MEKTKPTPTLAKLYVSQEKFAYALAIYLYLQEKEGTSYKEEICQAVKAITESRWKDYPESIQKSFKKDELAALQIVPDEIEEFALDALRDIDSDFESEIEEEQKEEENEQEDEPEEVTEEEIEEDAIEDKEDLENLDAVERDPAWDEIESTDSDEEIPFPKLEGEVYKESKVEPEKADQKKKNENEEELVPGVKDFESNFKEEVTRGLLDESKTTKDQKVEQQLEKAINEKFVLMLRKLRSLSNSELKKLLSSKLAEGRKPEELTLAELEELLD